MGVVTWQTSWNTYYTRALKAIMAPGDILEGCFGDKEGALFQVTWLVMSRMTDTRGLLVVALARKHRTEVAAVSPLS